MGTTLDAMQSGSFAYSYVVAIEGYPFLLTDSPTAAAVTAWAGTDWTQALGGLVVDIQNHGEINPWAPFGPGGSCRLWVQPDSTDQFGIDTNRMLAGAETQLAATIDHDDTTITVNDTGGFASSGDLFVGTECMGYSAKTGTTFTASKRGKYAPFSSGGASPVGFSQHHRVGLDSNLVALSPVVTAQPRTWIGKWVGVWLHRKQGGVLDVKAQAQLVFAGRIAGIQDDANTGWAVVDVEHVLDYVKDATIGRSMFAGQIADGVYLDVESTMRFTWTDVDKSGVGKLANDLVVVASGASGANQINAGYYSHADLCTALNNWLGAELIAGRLYGFYRVRCPELQGDGTWRTVIDYQIPPGTGSSDIASATVVMPLQATLLFGFSKTATWTDNRMIIETPFASFSTDGSTKMFQYVSPSPAQRTVLSWKGTISTGNKLPVQQTSGTFYDQATTLPSSIRPPLPTSLKWGVFLVDNKLPIRASYDTSGFISNIVPLQNVFGAFAGAEDSSGSSPFTKGFDDPNEIQIRQVIIAEYPFLGLVARLFYCTGTSAYNSATYDDLGFGLGVPVPGELLGASFESSLANLPGSSSSAVFVLDRPTKLVDLIAGDLVLRRACLVWRQGALRFAQIVTPTTNVAVATLDEATKAIAVGTTDVGSQRSASLLATDWQKSIVKISYNRSIADLSGGGGGYQSTLTLEDAVAVDDQGGAGDPYTIEARNTYGQFATTGAGVEQLAPNFLATMPLFSRPARRLARPIDQRFFEQIAPGDVVLITDKFARDPATGQRKITERPGVVVSLDYTLGSIKPGGDSGKPSPIAGSVVIFFLDLNRGAAYSPTAQVDDTANTGGFTDGHNATTRVLRCYAHQHTEASEAADASFFAIGDIILVCEIDPANTAAPLKWLRQVTAISGNDVTYNAPALGTGVGESAFSTTKKYRIFADDYVDVQTTQQVNTFQASSTTGNIESARPPFTYSLAITPGVSSYTPWAAGELGEFVPDLAGTAGFARDTGHDRALVRLVNALHDYRTAHCSPLLWAQRVAAPGAGATYTVLYYAPIFLGPDLDVLGVAYRELRVAPFLKSNTGSSVSVRVSLMQRPLTAAASLDDVDRGAIFGDATWTTSSTTYATGAEIGILTNAKNASGVTYLLVEGTTGAATYGLAECQESMRQIA